MDNRVTHHSDKEIKVINSTVDIGLVAESLGFKLGKDKSSVNSRSYTRDSDRIVVRNSPRYPGQEYYSLGKSREEGDCGPAFNFVYFREGKQNMGKTRQILRPYIGTLDGTVPVAMRTTEEEAPEDRSEEWEALNETPLAIKKHVVNHLYKMGLTRETLKTFQGLVRADLSRNACFASRLHNGRVVGWSIRGTQDKKFRSNHGTKALFWGPQGKEAEYLVVCESPLDALSYWQLFHEEVDVAVSATSGNTGDYMSVLLLARELGAKQVIVATDADAAGQKQGEALASVLIDAGIPWFYHRPPAIDGVREKDWNKYLLAQLKKKEAA